MQVFTLAVSGLKSHHNAGLANGTLRAATDDPSAAVEINPQTGVATVSTNNVRLRREELVATLKHVHFDAK